MLKKIHMWWVELFRKKIHTSWLIASVASGFLAGVGLSAVQATALFGQTFFFALAIIFLIPIFASRLRIMILFAIITGLFIGLWRGTLTRVDLDIYSDFLGQNVVLRGKVSEDPDFGPSHDLRVRLVDVEVILQADYNKLLSEEIENDEDLNDYFTALPGQVWASAFLHGGIEVKRSDVVEITGQLRPGFGTFPANMSFANLSSVTHSLTADPMRDLRDGFGDKLRQVIPSPAADLGMGILAGQKTALPFALSAAFMIASLTHIVVASGYNLTILTRFARRLFSKISRFAALGFGGGLVFAFASVTGFSPSMTRASLVAGFSLLAWYYGRKFHPVVLLTIVAAIT
ncbi:ComEC/Rec2 family competence protein, partial [Candidatus Saccharibacteria bacterium]|nr:ComEC/Rec2 family competence protein [Candidatus Saccharibacteria bacterium]